MNYILLLLILSVVSKQLILRPNRRLHRCFRFPGPSDEIAGPGCCCFSPRWHGWSFWGDQGWVPEICLARILIFQFYHFRCPLDFRQRVVQAKPRQSYCIFSIILCWVSDWYSITQCSMPRMFSGFYSVPIVPSIFGTICCVIFPIYNYITTSSLEGV